MKNSMMFRLLSTLGLVASCAPPAVGVNVTRDGDRYVLSIRACATPQARIQVSDIVVRDATQTPDTNDPQCRLEFKPSALHAGKNNDIRDWTYGTELSNFDLLPCRPLEHGRTYVIDAGVSTGDLLARFSIDGTGNVKMQDGACPH